MSSTPVRLAALVLLATGTAALGATSAHAGGGDETQRRGSCSNGAEWSIKVKPDDGRIEVEAEIDTDRAGRSWGWVLKHNGSLSARGTSRTTARSGSFEVHRRAVDAAGTDTFRFRASRGGAVCVATISL